MSTALLIIGDGRTEIHERSWQSAKQNLPPFDHKVIVDDADHKLGFGGAIRKGWSDALATGADWVFHLEADFLFTRKVPLHTMQRVMEAHPYLVQMALLRQPWNQAERLAGGVWQQHRGDYLFRAEGADEWFEHRRFVTTNPALWPSWVLRAGWPEGPESEGRFGIALFESDPKLRAAFWGDGSEWVEHLGTVRTGHGY
jgi:hypothetical protein